jgi:cell division protein FtsW (lipid II flippase)
MGQPANSAATVLVADAGRWRWSLSGFGAIWLVGYSLALALLVLVEFIGVERNGSQTCWLETAGDGFTTSD